MTIKEKGKRGITFEVVIRKTVDGRPIYDAKTFERSGDADRWEARRTAEILSGQYLDTDKTLVRDIIDAYRIQRLSKLSDAKSRRHRAKILDW